jgi:hypothetical protein
VCERARALGFHTPVLFMTGHSADLAGDEGPLLIQKPFRIEDLARQVRRALDQQPSPAYRGGSPPVPPSPDPDASPSPNPQKTATR